MTKNGLDSLIRAMHSVDAVLLLVGSGKQASKLRSLALDLGISDRVHFIGHVSHAELPGYLSIADVFVRPSRSEGLGSAFLEAMAAGLPVVATRVGGIPDIVQDGQNGLFCEVNHPKDVAEKINRILGDDGLRQRLAQGGRQTAQQHDWSKIAEQLQHIFQSL